MATGGIPIMPDSATFPDGSASNAVPLAVRVKSSVTAPMPYRPELWFDASTREQVCWSFPMPPNFASGLVLKFKYKMVSATTGGVAIEARIAATTPGVDAADLGAKAFAAANTGTGTVPGTAGHTAEISITMTNADSVAAGDIVVLYIARDVANGSDTATGDLCFVAGELQYTTT